MKSDKIICLLIEDDHDDVEIFRMILSDLKMSAEVIAVKDCDALLKMIEECVVDPHCIFLNGYKLRMSNNDCLKKIQNIQGLTNKPIGILAEDRAFINESHFESPHAKIIYREGPLAAYGESLNNFFASL